MTTIPIIASAADVPGAVRHAQREAGARWYVARRAEALGRGDLIPRDWGITAAAATRPVARERLTRRQDGGKMGRMTRPITAAVSGDWDPDLHPRDRKGRFIEKMDLINIFSVEGGSVVTGRGVAVGNSRSAGGEDFVHVQRDDGKTVKVPVSRVESAPPAKAKLDDADAADRARRNEMQDPGLSNRDTKATSTETDAKIAFRLAAREGGDDRKLSDIDRDFYATEEGKAFKAGTSDASGPQPVDGDYDRVVLGGKLFEKQQDGSWKTRTKDPDNQPLDPEPEEQAALEAMTAEQTEGIQPATPGLDTAFEGVDDDGENSEFAGYANQLLEEGRSYEEDDIDEDGESELTAFNNALQDAIASGDEGKMREEASRLRSALEISYADSGELPEDPTNADAGDLADDEPTPDDDAFYEDEEGQSQLGGDLDSRVEAVQTETSILGINFGDDLREAYASAKENEAAGKWTQARNDYDSARGDAIRAGDKDLAAELEVKANEMRDRIDAENKQAIADTYGAGPTPPPPADTDAFDDVESDDDQPTGNDPRSKLKAQGWTDAELNEMDEADMLAELGPEADEGEDAPELDAAGVADYLREEGYDVDTYDVQSIMDAHPEWDNGQVIAEFEEWREADQYAYDPDWRNGGDAFEFPAETSRQDIERFLIEERDYGADVVADLSDQELYDDWVAEGGETDSFGEVDPDTIVGEEEDEDEDFEPGSMADPDGQGSLMDDPDHFADTVRELGSGSLAVDPDFGTQLNQDARDDLQGFRGMFDVDSEDGSWASGMSGWQFDNLIDAIDTWEEDNDAVDEATNDRLVGIVDYLDRQGIDSDAEGIARVIEARKQAMEMGWSQEEQMRNILEGQSIDEQNPAALRNIAEFLRNNPLGENTFGEGELTPAEVASDIEEYLDLSGREASTPDRTEGLTPEQLQQYDDYRNIDGYSEKEALEFVRSGTTPGQAPGVEVTDDDLQRVSGQTGIGPVATRDILSRYQPGEDRQAAIQRINEETNIGKVAIRDTLDAYEGTGGYAPETSPEAESAPESASQAEGGSEAPTAPADHDEATHSQLLLMARSADKESVDHNRADAENELRTLIDKVHTGEHSVADAHKEMAGLMTRLKLGGKQRKRYRELLDKYFGQDGGDDSAKVQADAVADNLRDDNPVKEKLKAKASATLSNQDGTPGATIKEPTDPAPKAEDLGLSAPDYSSMPAGTRIRRGDDVLIKKDNGKWTREKDGGDIPSGTVGIWSNDKNKGAYLPEQPTGDAPAGDAAPTAAEESFIQDYLTKNKTATRAEALSVARSVLSNQPAPAPAAKPSPATVNPKTANAAMNRIPYPNIESGVWDEDKQRQEDAWYAQIARELAPDVSELSDDELKRIASRLNGRGENDEWLGDSDYRVGKLSQQFYNELDRRKGKKDAGPELDPAQALAAVRSVWAEEPEATGGQDPLDVMSYRLEGIQRDLADPFTRNVTVKPAGGSEMGMSKAQARAILRHMGITPAEERPMTSPWTDANGVPTGKA